MNRFSQAVQAISVMFITAMSMRPLAGLFSVQNWTTTSWLWLISRGNFCTAVSLLALNVSYACATGLNAGVIDRYCIHLAGHIAFLQAFNDLFNHCIRMYYLNCFQKCFTNSRSILLNDLFKLFLFGKMFQDNYCNLGALIIRGVNNGLALG